ncbi:unnamed protein product [Protopolystoma xenopodis]|uniref:Uncharacterized protein n=1 Tax=Protopolystoma xenopodis TaxID=117903 RepID=A0A3S5BU73_9PLAT|nr:unnamed protein product [Protopolystoma xenopodis]
MDGNHSALTKYTIVHPINVIRIKALHFFILQDDSNAAKATSGEDRKIDEHVESEESASKNDSDDADSDSDQSYDLDDGVNIVHISRCKKARISRDSVARTALGEKSKKKKIEKPQKTKITKQEEKSYESEEDDNFDLEAALAEPDEEFPDAVDREDEVTDFRLDESEAEEDMEVDNETHSPFLDLQELATSQFLILSSLEVRIDSKNVVHGVLLDLNRAVAPTVGPLIAQVVIFCRGGAQHFGIPKALGALLKVYAFYLSYGMPAARTGACTSSASEFWLIHLEEKLGFEESLVA